METGKMRFSIPCRQFLLSLGFQAVLGLLSAPAAPAATYYVSSSTGNDSNNGLSEQSPFQTLERINGLALGAGDNVLLRCGDVWRAEYLRMTRSGASGNPITFGSYPDAACASRPILDGTRPIVGWTPSSGSVWEASLSSGANAGLFPDGINQLFRDGDRLRLGRWPNLDAGDGYSTIDGQSGAAITDAQLPAGNWAGASAHIRGMRWYILNRDVTSSAGTTLYLNASPGCWGGSCAGWGYFLNGHRLTLDQEGEWHYDSSTRRVYLFSAADPNAATIDGSVIFDYEDEPDGSPFMGAIILGRHLQEHISYVTIDNLEIRRWFDNGVTTPVNLERDENFNIRLRNLVIRDVDSTGINLATWVWNAQSGYSGWRGGRNVEITNTLIERANEYGINTYARQSLISGNTLRDIARIGNVGRAGIGCETDDGEGLCTEPGDGIRLKVDSDGAYSSNNVTVELNRLERIGYNGMDVFGYQNTLRRNVISEACITKGDCGAVRLFGGDSLALSPVHDVTLQDNIMLDVIGNTDGTHADFRSLFGFGLYVDNNSRAVTSIGNTVARATAAGILYQRSTGAIQGNTLHDNSPDIWSRQIVLTDEGTTAVSSLTGNVMVALTPTAGTLYIRNASQATASDRNGFYHASRPAHIHVSASGQDRTLAQWQAYSGKDSASRERVNADIERSRIFVNDQQTTQIISLPGAYTDLDGNPVGSSLELEPFSSRVRGEIGAVRAPRRLRIQDR
jgi:hypothetical protein